jgi:hypothetical protein
VERDSDFAKIPLSIMMLEASLTYMAMWTGLMLRAGVYVVPLLAGLFLLNVDALMDPVVAAAYNCQGVLHAENGNGLGFWHWYHPGGEAAYIGNWFGVPLYNYAAWWAAPVSFIAVAMFFQWGCDRTWCRICRSKLLDTTILGRQAAVLFVLGLVLFSLFVLILLAPNEYTPSIWLQWAVMSFILGGTLVAVVRRVRAFDTQGSPDPALVQPPIILLGVSAAALLLEGFFLDMAGLILVGLVSLVICALLTWWPYQKQVYGFAKRLQQTDQFVRLHSFSFTTIVVLISAFGVALRRTDVGELPRDIEKWEVTGVLLAAAAFHVFAHAWCHVFDRKAASGAVTREKALAIALVQPAIAVLAWFLLGGSLQALAVLAAGFFAIAACGVWVKRSKKPLLLMDLVQGLVWASLAWFAALVTLPEGGTDKWILVWAVVAYSVCAMLLVGGIHCRLRELDTHLPSPSPTAIWLGVRAGEATGPQIRRSRICILAFAVHIAMFAIPAWIVGADVFGLAEKDSTGLRSARAAVTGLFAVTSGVLVPVLLEKVQCRGRWMVWHFVLLLLFPVFSFMAFLDFTAMAILVAFVFRPLLAQESIVRGFLAVTHGAPSPGVGP